MFERIDTAEKFYEGGKPSKTTIREDTNCAILFSKRKGGEYASPTNPYKGCYCKCKTNHAGHLRDRTTGDKTCFVNGPGHSTKECKLLKE